MNKAVDWMEKGVSSFDRSNDVFLVGKPIPELTRWICFDEVDFFKYAGGEVVPDEVEAMRLELKYVYSNN